MTRAGGRDAPSAQDKRAQQVKQPGQEGQAEPTVLPAQGRRRAMSTLCGVAALAAWPPSAWAAGDSPQPAAPASAPSAERGAGADSGPLPLQAWAELPLLTDAALSPDGQRLAALVHLGPQDGVSGVVVRDLQGGASRALLRSDAGLHIAWVEWANDQRLLVGTRHAGRRGFVGTVETRLLSVRADGGGAFNLHQPPVPGKFGTPRGAQLQDRVVDLMSDDPQHVLLAYPPEGVAYPGVYKVNVDDGQRQLVQPPMPHVQGWLTDARHRVRVALLEEETETEVRACDPDGKRWRSLWRFGRWSGQAVWPLGFGADPQRLLVRALHQGRMAVFSVDLAQEALPRELLLAHPQRDLDAPALRHGGAVLGLRIGDGQTFAEPRAEIWDASLRSLALEIDRALPGRHCRLLQLSADGRRYLLHASGSAQPGAYYAGDRGTGRLAMLASQHPRLPPERLAGKRRLHLKARDGLPLQAFVTLPPGTAADANGRPAAPLPLVLLPHGGPRSRDDDDFDLWAEFIASRGYAVLQVNFRGSSGLGHGFEHAGLRRWGLEMQDDLSDAVRWAIDTGLADPRRLAIVGGSYGGYAALMGAVRTPKLYRCVVSFAGVSDLSDLIQHMADYRGGAAWAEATIGREWGDRAQLQATSPAQQAQHIAVPVLLVHGSADRVVPVQQSRAMARALERLDKPVRFVEQPEGDHHLGRYPHRLQFFELLEVFLKEHLG